MINFLYTQQLPQDAKFSQADELKALLQLADKYEVASMVDACASDLDKKLTLEQAVDALEWTTKLKLATYVADLVANAKRVIVEEFKVCLVGECGNR